MQVTFPYTNPIVFTRPGQYHNWRDAYSFAQRGCFLQPFAAEDRITFQFSWRGVRRNRTHTIKVEVVTGDSRATFTQYAISGTASGGTAGKSCYSQTPTGILYADGYYVFSVRTRDITDLAGTPLVLPEDTFHFVVTADGKEYESNTLKWVTDTEGTKLMHYADSQPYAMDTHFDAVPNGYDIRLPSCFLHPKPGADSEVFESYQKDLEMVSAIPFETIDLEIGRHTGIPDWWAKNLNHILHCDEKSIDGVGYELTANAVVEPQYADGYAFGWITVEMARRRNAQSYSDGGTDTYTYTYTEEEQAYKEVWFEIPPGQPLAVKTESASVLIESFGRDWYLDDGGAGAMKEVAPNKVSGSGNQRVEFTAGRNASKDAKERLLYVRETGTDRLLMTIRLCQRARRQGISFGAVGDTLFVYEESLVN